MDYQLHSIAPLEVAQASANGALRDQRQRVRAAGAHGPVDFLVFRGTL
jgi:hypothetical protein